jgi:ubiquinone/menaquinone biosynthesis C-methylase UbiE
VTDRDRVARRVREHWDGRAATFDDQPEHAMHSEAQRQRWLDLLESWTDPAPQTTLDVGCGTGVVSALLADLGHDVTGIDAAPEMVRRARRKAREDGRDIAFGLGDATRLGIRADAVEQVVERHLLWTLPDPAAALAEWRRVVEPGGRIVVFEGRWQHDDHREDYAAIHEELPLYDGRSGDEWAQLLADSGLVDVDWAALPDPVLRGREPGTELANDYVVLAGTVPG